MQTLRVRLIAAMVLIGACAGGICQQEPIHTDVVVYGATPSGIMAAVAAARLGQTVALVEPTKHIGGVVSGGLTISDVGRAETIGGLAREFFDRVLKYYSDTYGADSPQAQACDHGYKFEPHVAEAIFEQMVTEQAAIKVYRKNRIVAAATDGGAITELVAEDVATGQMLHFAGKVFIDASYSGDLMAAAEAAYRVGRESRSEYGESLAGTNRGDPAILGTGDHRIQAFNYRVCLTDRADDRLPVPKPDGYDPDQFPGILGAVTSGRAKTFDDLFNIDRWRLPNDKIDANIADHPGVNYAYPEGDYEARQRIESAQRSYSLACLYFMQNDLRLPEAFRTSAREWGLPKDEFADNDNFPDHIYIREARRMIGRYVMTQRDVLDTVHKDDGICVGSYGIDCHQVQRLMSEKGWTGEGGLEQPTEPYEIPYRSLTPFAPSNLLVTVCISASHVAYATIRMESVYMMMGHAAGVAAHLAVQANTAVQTVDVKSLRYLLRGQGQLLDAPFRPRVDFTWSPAKPAVGQSVAFSVREVEVRDPIVKFWWNFDGSGSLDSEERNPSHAFLIAKRCTVSLFAEDASGRQTKIVTHEVPVGDAVAADVTMDNSQATYAGVWRRSSAAGPFFGDYYVHDSNAGKGTCAARFRPDLPRPGRYVVCLSYSPQANRASNVPVTVGSRDGETKVTLDERTLKTVFPFVPIGEFNFNAGTGGYVLIRNDGTDGFVVVDAARWIWLGK